MLPAGLQAFLLDFSMYVFGKFTLMLSNIPGPQTQEAFPQTLLLLREEGTT